MEAIRLLLVDDEPPFREAIARRLVKRGFSPRQAGSGAECLALLATDPMDVIVLDVKMPGMNGIEVLQRIKHEHPRTEVILLTGQATPQDGVEGIKAGGFDYLTKPIEIEHLAGKITQAYAKLQHEEARKREAAFRAQMEQQMIATERLASLGTLAVGVAHEINNPLAIIRESAGYLSLLLNRPELAAMPCRREFALALGKIEKGIDRASRITHQLLGTVKKADSALAEINLPGLVEETFELVQHAARDRDIRLVKAIDPALEPIWSDPYQLRQVLINLITNAVQATGAGGRVTVRGVQTPGGATLSVEDTGSGIPRENLGKIFEPFFSTKAPGEGTGLGLFVSHGIVNKLGGKLSVESRVGRGSVFRIELPQKSATRTAGPCAPAAIKEQGGQAP